MKRSFVLLLGAALAFSFFSCDKQPPEESTVTEAAVVEVSEMTDIQTEPLPEQTAATEPPTTAETTVTEGTSATTDYIPIPPETSESTVTSAPPVTSEPPETSEPSETAAPDPFDYESSDLGEYAILGKYLGIEVFAPAPAPVTDADIEVPINEFIETLPPEVMIYNRAAELYDKVNISYICTVDGAMFKPACKENIMLILGDGEFPDSFEENFVGMLPGDVKNLSFEIPESYGEAYDGKTAQFSLILNYIYPTLNDEIAIEYFGCSSAAELREIFREHLEQQAVADMIDEKQTAAWTKVLANSLVIEYPEDALSAAFENLIAEYEARAAASGMTYEEFFENEHGISASEADMILLEKARNSVEQKLILYLLAKNLDIAVNLEAYEAEMAEYAAEGGYSSVEEMLSVSGYTKNEFKDILIYEKALSIVIENANFIEFGR